MDNRNSSIDNSAPCSVTYADHAHQSSGLAPSFLRNTHDMITFCDRSNQAIASWSKSGMQMVIYDKEKLTNDIFPGYFKHSNFKSFARQLNFYGFRKIKSKNKDCCIYHHDNFVRGRPDLLSHIQRQTSECLHDSSSVIGTQKFPAVLTNMNEVNELKEKVTNLTSTVTVLQKEIAGLRLLVTTLSDKLQTHDLLIHEISAPQIINTAPINCTNGLHGHRSFEHVEQPNDDALKPQARQLPSPKHNSVSQGDSFHNAPAYAYGTLVSQDHHLESYPAKRQRSSPDESVAYAAAVGTQHVYTTSTHAASMQSNVHHGYKHPPDHWTIHTTDNAIESHQINGQLSNDSNNSQINEETNSVINNANQTTVSTSTSLMTHDAECSADYDFGYEDLAWFALFEEDVSHQTDDPIAAPQA